MSRKTAFRENGSQRAMPIAMSFANAEFGFGRCALAHITVSRFATETYQQIGQFCNQFSLLPSFAVGFNQRTRDLL
jgi:hypothetical protein